MTIYKAVRNFLTVFVVLAVAAGALCIGGGVYYAVQSAASSQVLSKLGSTGAEVTRVQKKLKELGYYSGAADPERHPGQTAVDVVAVHRLIDGQMIRGALKGEGSSGCPVGRQQQRQQHRVFGCGCGAAGQGDQC